MISSELRDLATQSRPSGVVGCPSIGNDISFSTLIRAARVMTFEELVLHVGAVGATHGELLHGADADRVRRLGVAIRSIRVTGTPSLTRASHPRVIVVTAHGQPVVPCVGANA